jgi:hypothetical protein
MITASPVRVMCSARLWNAATPRSIRAEEDELQGTPNGARILSMAAA